MNWNQTAFQHVKVSAREDLLAQPIREVWIWNEGRHQKSPLKCLGPLLEADTLAQIELCGLNISSDMCSLVGNYLKEVWDFLIIRLLKS